MSLLAFGGNWYHGATSPRRTQEEVPKILHQSEKEGMCNGNQPDIVVIHIMEVSHQLGGFVTTKNRVVLRPSKAVHSRSPCPLLSISKHEGIMATEPKGTLTIGPHTSLTALKGKAIPSRFSVTVVVPPALARA